ncbi:ADP-ribosylglycohydrolase family protein [Paenibacillus sp. HB172176]|uniref:ADP-ribosylglycohydrolase family protein n=1 Tax=Paenibacillus sp. HB172176 TaxID=2493690 RepID=UPI001439E436|nr:ADP-ribosylglycohydrolase family protein [Paenibacillus sp. HB172176]
MDGAARIDRIKGGLFGLAVGDALGGTTEFMTESEINKQYGVLTEIIGGGVWQLEPGEVTDDTMMTLAVAEGILQNPLQPVEAIGRRFLEWYASKPKDIGNTIRAVFHHFQGDWFAAAQKAAEELGVSGGNGSLMRCLPVALYYDSLEEIETVTRLQSRMTHVDERCDEACALYCRMAHRLLLGEDLVPVLEQELERTRYEDVLLEEPSCEPTGFVVHSMAWSMHHLLRSDSFEAVIQGAANKGGDSDTIAAIAGGLAGMYYGYEAIPARYKESILIRERLEHTAASLAAVHKL